MNYKQLSPEECERNSEATEIIGYVTILYRLQIGEPGSVRISALPQERTDNIRLMLDAVDYTATIHASENNFLVKFSRDLIKWPTARVAR